MSFSVEYDTPRLDTDIDLVEEVRNILLQYGLINNVTTFYDQDPIIKEAKLRSPLVQRHLLNRYWNFILVSNTEVQPSLDERYCLINDGSITEWLNYFKSKVIIYIANNNLPNRFF